MQSLIYPQSGWLYVLSGEFWPDQVFKIGETKTPMSKRLRGYRTHNPGNVKVEASFLCKDVQLVEECALRYFRQNNLLFRDSREFVACPLDRLLSALHEKVGLVRDAWMPDYFDLSIDALLQFARPTADLSQEIDLSDAFEPNPEDTARIQINLDSHQQHTNIGTSTKTTKASCVKRRARQMDSDVPKGIYFHEKRRAWVVQIQHNYRRFLKFFSVVRKGDAQAMQEALQFRLKILSQPRSRLSKETRQSPPGIYYNAKWKAWVAAIQRRGTERKVKKFYVSEFGSDDAFSKACAWRQSIIKPIESCYSSVLLSSSSEPFSAVGGFDMAFFA